MKSNFLSLGFRPFFLFSSLISFSVMALWLLTLSGYSSLPLQTSPINWHAHEMLFGFASAALYGFLFTASQNWSGVRGVHGKRLFAFVLIWFLGRFGWFFSPMQIFDLLTLPLFIFLLSPYLWNHSGGRNRKILFMLAALWIADALTHSQFSGLGRAFAVDILIGFILLISGRILPFFKSKALKTPQIKNLGFLEITSSILFILFTLSSFQPHLPLRQIFAALLFISHLIRWLRWKPFDSIKAPILGVLFLGYFWLILGFLSACLAPRFNLQPSLTVHLFTVGGLAIIITGMMTRVSLGHTGRPIKASVPTLACYVFINLALVSRAILPAFFPQLYPELILWSGLFWCLSFLLFFIEYFKALISPRPDGREG